MSFLFCVICMGIARAQNSATDSPPPAITFTAEQDHQNMMDQLGITALRPGPSGNERAPNHANYDEAKANPFPDIPDPLITNTAQKVTSAKMWWDQRRPELVEMFEKYVYGRVPTEVPKVTWTVRATDHEMIAFTPVIVKDLIGTVDNSSYPAIAVKLHMTLVTPANAKGPVPVLMMFGKAGFPAPNEPSAEEFERINNAWKALLIQQDPSLQDVFAQHPAWDPVKATPFQFPQLTKDGDPPATWQLIGAGWGFALFDTASVQADDGAGITRGIIGLVNKGQPRRPDDWGALRAWAWGASRGLDYLQTDPAVDAKHVGIEGVSRFGKAALVTMAFDQRFAMMLVGSSGKGGSTLLRRNFGEAVENLTGGEYYWMAGNFMKYGASDPPKTAADLPVDSHELIALCAPRPCFISYGTVENGDAKWVDAHGSFMAGVLAGPVYRLLGKKDFGTPGDYLTDPMPPLKQLIGGELAWRQHEGGHDVTPNWPAFFEWVGNYIKSPGLREGTAATPADQPSPRTDSNSQIAHAELLEK